MRAKTIVAASAICLATVCSADPFPTQIKWDTTVHDGYINDVANWKDRTTLPGDGDTQVFDLSGTTGDYTVRVGPGTNFAQQACFYVVNMPKGTKFTLDTTGGSYVQAAAHYPAAHLAFGFFESGTAHWCNFESVDTAGNNPVCCLEDGVIEVERSSDNIYSFTLKRGTFSSYHVGGAGDSSDVFMFGNRGDGAVANFQEGGRFLAYGITQRGGIINFTGGDHELGGALRIGDAYDFNPKVDISGGSVTIYGQTYVGASSKQRSATLDVHNDAQFTAAAIMHIGATTMASNSAALFRDNSVSSLAGVYAGDGQCLNAFMSVTNNAKVTATSLYIPRANNSTGTVDVAGNGSFTVNGNIGVAYNGNYANGRLRMRENAEMRITGSTTLGGAYQGIDCDMRVSDSATLACGSITAASGGRFTLEDDATLAASNAWLTVNGTNGVIELAGGRSAVAGFHVYGIGVASAADCGATNVIRITGGVHETIDDNGNYLPLTIGNGSSHSLFEMTGGEVTMPRIARVGWYGTAPGSATFRMTGGRFNLINTAVRNEAVLNIADSVNSVGVLELFGGRLSAQAVRGWTGSLAKNGSGRASLYADGGTVAAISISPSVCFMQYFDDAVLGSKGLVLDTLAYNINIDQAFTDAPGAAGRFTKLGTGTLAFKRSSTHGETILAGGTLLAENASATQFGQNVVVTNGATLSIAGAATSFTAESLVLGDAETRGFLALDSGDVVTLTGDDPISVGRGFVVCGALRSAAGAYDLIRFTGAIDADAVAAELSKLSFHNGDNTYAYTFTLADDGGAKVARLAVVARVTTSATWTGATSGAWGTPENWQGNVVPNADSDATFPSDAANRAVSSSAEAALYAMRIAGDYTFGGTGPYAPDVIEVAAGGSAEFSAAVSPKNTALYNVGEGAALKFVASLTSENGSMSASKEGSGLLDLAVASPLWAGDWTLNGGMTRLAASGALGTLVDAAVGVTIGPATLSFTNAPSAYTRSFTFNPGAQKAAVFDTGADAALAGSFNSLSGGLVKRGTAKLTLKGGTGTFELETDQMGGAVNADPSTTVTIPANGDSPTKDGLGGLTVLEGVMRLDGNGSASTIFKQTHHLMIGAIYNAAANPEVEVANCRFNQGGGGYHLDVGGGTPVVTGATVPTLRAVEGGYVSANGIKVGNRGHVSGSALDVRPTMCATNGILEATYAFLLGTSGDSHVKAVLRAGEGGVMRVTRNSAVDMANNTLSGILWQGDVDAEIADGGWLGLSSAGNWGFCLYDNAIGEMRFVRGGKMRTPRITSYGTSAKNEVRFVFDGGVLELIASGESVVSGAAKRSFRLDGAGVEVVVGSGLRHVVEMPVNGEGGLVKSGDGEFVLGVGKTIASAAVTNDSGLVTANWTGGTQVKGGTLTIEAGAAREDLAVDVDDGATLSLVGSQTLGAISGGGTIAGAAAAGDPAPTLACTVSTPWDEANPGLPLFENITLSSVTVDFNAPDGEAYKTGDVVPVARLGEGASTDLRAWNTVNAGRSSAPTSIHPKAWSMRRWPCADCI
jgi:hypothetical protein